MITMADPSRKNKGRDPNPGEPHSHREERVVFRSPVPHHIQFTQRSELSDTVRI